MKRFTGFLILMFLFAMFASVTWADKDIIVGRGLARRFATLPASSPGFPEGIAADASGNLYVSTFSFTNPAFIHVFNPRGALIDTIPVPAGDAAPVALLGLAFDQNGALFVADFANGEDFNGRILKIFPPDSSGTITEFVPPGTLTAPNALAFNSGGDLFVSDSFQGTIYKITSEGTVSPLINDPRLMTSGFPPFGANGLAFGDEGTLFIANTGDDRVLRLNLSTLELVVLTESINGADGLVFDRQGILWVAANQADEVVGLNRDGRVIAKLGDFLGVRRNGSVRGLLFPASLVIVKKHRTERIFVTNLALPLTGTAAEPEADVSKYTVSQIRIPDLRRDRRDRDDDDDD